jgi:hypothetical protein
VGGYYLAYCPCAFAAGFEGLLVPSAANGWVNLVLFPENLLPGSSVTEKGRKKMKLGG